MLLVAGFTPFSAVFWATVLAFGLSFIRPETALWPRRLLAALERGAMSMVSVAATTATAGIIVGVVTLTGLGLKVAGIIVALADGQLLLTVVYAAVAVWLLGLAVPVTASYIIAAVMMAPALTQVGVSAIGRAHVHLLLRRAVRGQPADGALALRRRRHHRWPADADDDAHVEVHDCRRSWCRSCSP